MVKISLDVFNCLQFLYAVQELGDSLHDVVYMYLHVRTKTIVIGIFCVWTSQPQNIFNLLFF